MCKFAFGAIKAINLGMVIDSKIYRVRMKNRELSARILLRHLSSTFKSERQLHAVISAK